ncbi:MAG: hypothetical protein LBP31_01625 [Holosporales bacterium]|nr:hypothetical protein [Holosporales bacterium]
MTKLCGNITAFLIICQLSSYSVLASLEINPSNIDQKNKIDLGIDSESNPSNIDAYVRDKVIKIFEKIGEKFGATKEYIEAIVATPIQTLIDQYGEQKGKDVIALRPAALSAISDLASDLVSGLTGCNLNYDCTVPAVELYKKKYPQQRILLMIIGTVFRNEKKLSPQHLRTAIQLEMDYFGSTIDGLIIDSSNIIKIAMQFVNELGLQNYVVILNDVRIINAILMYLEAPFGKEVKIKEFFDGKNSRKPKENEWRESVSAGLIELGCNSDKVNSFVNFCISYQNENPHTVLGQLKTLLTEISGTLGSDLDSAIVHISSILSNFSSEKFKHIKFDPSFARLPNFYNGLWLEMRLLCSSKVAEFADVALLGGGAFKINEVQGVGWAFGLDRLLIAMSQLGLIKRNLQPRLVLYNFISINSEINEVCRRIIEKVGIPTDCVHPLHLELLSQNTVVVNVSEGTCLSGEGNIPEEQLTEVLNIIKTETGSESSSSSTSTPFPPCEEITLPQTTSTNSPTNSFQSNMLSGSADQSIDSSSSQSKSPDASPKITTPKSKIPTKTHPLLENFLKLKERSQSVEYLPTDSKEKIPPMERSPSLSPKRNGNSYDSISLSKCNPRPKSVIPNLPDIALNNSPASNAGQSNSHTPNNKNNDKKQSSTSGVKSSKSNSSSNVGQNKPHTPNNKNNDKKQLSTSGVESPRNNSSSNTHQYSQHINDTNAFDKNNNYTRNVSPSSLINIPMNGQSPSSSSSSSLRRGLSPNGTRSPSPSSYT